MDQAIFAPDALATIDRAVQEARRAGHRVVGLPHLLLALSTSDCAAARALDEIGGDRAALRIALLDRLVHGAEPFDGVPEPSERLQRLLRTVQSAGLATGRLVDDLVLLRAVLSVADGATAAALRALGLDGPALAARLDTVRAVDAAARPERAKAGHPAAKPAVSARATPVLDTLGRDLTALAREGKLWPVYGRDEEVRRVARTLLRRMKSNPLLLGDAGVGKTAIVEALAQRIASGNVRPKLRDLRLVEIPISALVAGTKYRGEFEERLRALVAEVQADPRIVLFLDEAHTLLGAGASESTPLDAANILKPALARGEVRCIGATTFEEYRRHIESDAALARRFQPIVIAEPSPGAALAILRQLAPRFAQHHGVSIDDAAIETAVRHAVAHLPERRLPDKTIDLLDEACSRVRLRTLRPTDDGRPTVTTDEIAAALPDWTGIAVGRLLADERQQLRALEQLLERRVVGQHQAVAAVARVLRLARTGLKDPRRLVGVLLFVGLPALARLRWHAPWPTCSTATQTNLSASICRNSARHIPWRA